MLPGGIGGWYNPALGGTTAVGTPKPTGSFTQPQFDPKWLNSLFNLFQTGQGQTAWPTLPGNVQDLLGTSRTAALAGLDQYAKASQGTLLGRLFGNNMQQSSDAVHQADTLSSQLGVDRANIESAYADKNLNAMQYGGNFGLQQLGALGNLLGTGGGLYNSAFGTLANLNLQDRQMLFDFLMKLMSGQFAPNSLGGGGLFGFGGGVPPGGAISGTGFNNFSGQQTAPNSLWSLLAKAFGMG